MRISKFAGITVALVLLTAYNPGMTALADGSTTVVLTNSDGGIQAVTFTVEVSKE